MPNTQVKVDFSDVESRGGKKSSGGRKRYPEGDYHVKVTKATIGKSGEKETPRVELELKIAEGKHKGGTLRDDLYLTEKSLWRVRQTMEAMGIRVPSKRVNIDVLKFQNKEYAVTLADEEYNDKVYSRVVDAFSLDELEEIEDSDADEVEDEDEDDEDTDEDTDDDEDDEDEDKKDEDLEDLDLDDI